MRNSYRRAGLGVATLALTAVIAVIPFAPGAKAAGPAASAFGATVLAGGEEVIPPEPVASVATPPGDATETTVDIPAEPVAISGTLTATANAHKTADIASGLTVVQQAVPGPYNARGLAQIQGLGVLFDVAGAGVPIVGATTVRSEAAVVCGATPRYTANSEIVDLTVGGEPVPVNGPVQDIIDGISGALADSGLNAVVDVQRNVVTQIPGGGIGVDALIVTVLAAAGDVPLAQIRLAHAEVTAAACPPTTQCSDGTDNDGDGKIDAQDPGCHSDGDPNNPGSYVPSDDDERDAPQCSDGRDNDGDGKIDILDPGCHSDGNANNPRSYVPSDNDEANAILPRTGGDDALPLAAAGLATLAMLGRRLRRRVIA